MKAAALRMTPAARAWLGGQGPARPLHIFSQVCNLIDEEGSVLSLQTDRLPDGPLSLTLPAAAFGTAGFDRWISGQTVVERGQAALQLGRWTIDWSRAATWDPMPDWGRLRQSEAWRGHLGALGGLLVAEAPPGGLAGLLGHGQPAADPLAVHLLAAAKPLAVGLQWGLASGDQPAMAEGAAGLAGLGGGLTPSGDDYLVGVMHALWAERPPVEAAELSWLLAETAAPRTTPLSAAWLRTAADGQASSLWHDLLSALLGQAGPVQPAARSLMAVGHTSGADALAGFLQTLATDR